MPDANDNAMFGMADPNAGPTAGGKVVKTISDADVALQKLLGTLGKIESKVDTIVRKFGGVGAAIGGGTAGGVSKHGRQDPSFPAKATSPGGTRFIPGLHNDSDIGHVPDEYRNGKQNPRFGGVGRGMGLAVAEAGVQGMLSSQGNLYDQDRLYTSMRLSNFSMGRGGQSALARQFADQFKGSYTSQADLQAAQYQLRSIGFKNSNYTPSFASGFNTYARQSNSASASDAMGQFAALQNPATQNLLRAYGIGVRGNDPNTVMKSIYSQVFSRGKPTTDQIETSFQIGGNAYQTAVNLGLDPAAFKDYSLSQVDTKRANKVINDSLPGTSKDRAGSANRLTQEAYGTRISTANNVNKLVGKVSDIADILDKRLPHLGAMAGTGLGTLGGNPAGGTNLLGSAMSSYIEAQILKSILGGGGGKGGGPVPAGLNRASIGGFFKSGKFKGGLAGIGLGIGSEIAGGALDSHGHHNWAHAARIGGSAASFAGMGAMVGGPWGAAIGGALGLGVGALQEFGGPDSRKAGTSGKGGQTWQQLAALAGGLGGGYAVTSTTGGKHAAGSLHYDGDAIDLGSRPRPGDPAGLLKIDQYFASKYGPHLSELIYGGPGGINIKNGRVLSSAEALKVYGAKTLAEHRNHVHVGATPGMLSGAGAPSGGDSAGGGIGAVGSGDAGPGGIGASALALAEHVRSMYTVGGAKAMGPGRGGGAPGAGGGNGGGKVSGAPANPTGSVAMGKKMAAARGWTGKQWDALYHLWQKESGWKNTAQNDHSTAYGIAQFLDGTWAGTGFKKTSDPSQQIAAGLQYIANRYGDPSAAWAHSQKNNWYSKGAWRIANDKKANLHEGEMVLPARIAEAVRGEMGRGMSKGAGGGPTKVDIHLTVQRATDAEAERFARRVKAILQDDDLVSSIANGTD